MKDASENILKSSKRKPNLIESDDGSEFLSKTFTDLLTSKNNKRFSRNTDKGAVFAERFNKSIRNILKRPVFGKSDANWVDMLPTITKQYNNRLHTSNKLTAIQATFKKDEGYVSTILIDKRKRNKPKFQVNDLFRAADLKRTFSKGDTNKWSHKLYKIKEFINDTIPSYHIDKLPERDNEVLLKKTNWTIKEKDSVMKKLNVN